MAYDAFISDLHLDPRRPGIQEILLNWLAGPARAMDTLYILGDLFEYWIGDDDPAPHLEPVFEALKQLADHGTATYFMVGNRDFLADTGFAERSGCRILDDPTVVTLHGRRAALSHGDALCTDDHEYQAFRRMVRDPQRQAEFLAQPLEMRRQAAVAIRERSRAGGQEKTEEIMDVNPEAVDRLMDELGVDLLIHGHTHRPNHHRWSYGDAQRERIVLSDWYTEGAVLIHHDGRFESHRLP